MKKLLIIISAILFLTACGGPELPEGFTFPDAPPNPEVMQPADNPME